jgi:DNA-directed RNA polymerase specialized sigma24 family protein
MLALSDHQLQLADALRRLPTERERAIFLRLIDEQLHSDIDEGVVLHRSALREHLRGARNVFL